MMKLFSKLRNFFIKYFFSPNWRCLACNKEIFDEGEYFCEQCIEKLPFIEGAICEHCGRKLKVFSSYCLTCKNELVETDKTRSVFEYSKPISDLIKKAKYYDGRYILTVFVEYLSLCYLKNYFNADLITYVPMTDKRLRARGYNQSKILAEGLARKVNVEIFNGIIKTHETKRQAKLSRSQRIKNLAGSFSVTDKNKVKGKKILIVDDVSTTGATGEAIAKILKGAGCSQVFLLTVASVSLKEKL